MSVRMTTVALALLIAPAIAQESRTGVSKPEPVVITAVPEESAPAKAEPAKPSAGKPVLTPRQAPQAAHTTTSEKETYGSYIPYPGSESQNTRLETQKSNSGAKAFNPDAAIVTSVEDVAGELREGTLLRVRLKEGLSTVGTLPGTHFQAELTEPVEKNGRVILPIGSMMEGRITEVHSGRRISGRAALHLDPRSVTLPDGTHYVIQAQLIDTDQLANTKVDREGTLLRGDHPKETLAVVGATTGAAAVAGGMIGGGVGAAVGAGIGAGASTIVWLKQDRQAVIPADALLIFSLTTPMDLRPNGSGGPEVSRMADGAGGTSPASDIR